MPAIRRRPFAAGSSPADGWAAFPLDGEALAEVRRVQAALDPADVLELEEHPHVTVRYGLRAADPAHLSVALKDAPGRPTWYVGPHLRSFPGEERDALWLSVGGTDPKTYHDALAAIPHEDAHAEYVPHVTVAYLKPGTAARHVAEGRGVGVPAGCPQLVYHPAGGGEPVGLPLPAGPTAPPVAAAFAEGGPGSAGPASDDFALPGPTGKRVAELLRESVADGRRALAWALAPALRRILDSGAMPETLFTEEEREAVAAAIRLARTAADVVGRVRVARHAEQIDQRKTAKFAADPLDVFAGPRPPAGGALDYFRSLVPKLGLDPERHAVAMDGRAAELAEATEATLLGKVKDALAKYLGTDWHAPPAGGESPASGPRVVQQVLDECGVTPASAGYAEMVFRTNVLDAYHTGFSEQLATPKMMEKFPVWRYVGIDDGRAGDDHRPRFGRYYPAAASFAAVRGPRCWNCRCSAIPVSYLQLPELEAAGGFRIEESW